MASEPIHDIAHLGHVELLTPKFEESRRFFIDVMGMTQSGEKGDSVFLRGWDDYERYSLKLTASKTSGLGHAAFRTRSPQALERRAAALKGSGFDIGWSDGDFGHGKTFVFKDPDGHKFEIYYETEWYEAPPELKPALKNQAQRYPARGINVRRIDHFNGLAVDIKANREFFQNYLGFMLTEQIVLDDGTEAGMWMTATNKSYDFAYTRDHTGTKGRLHHVTFALDAREDVLRAADVFLENGVYIETGPHKHAIQQTFFLYVYEPGGNRVEVSCAGARLVLAPDWKPITWTEAERKKGQAWGLQTIKSFHTKGTPPVRRRAGFVRADTIHDPPQHTTHFLHWLWRSRPSDRFRPARDRHRACRRLGHPVSGASGRKAERGGRKPGVRAASSARDAVSETDMIISAVTAASSVDAARSVAPHLAGNPYYLDINSVSPGRKQETAALSANVPATSTWLSSRQFILRGTARPCCSPDRTPKAFHRCCTKWTCNFRWSAPRSDRQPPSR